MVVSSLVHTSIASTDEELLFKAAFIYNFAKFTTWPDDAWQRQPDTITLCTVGNDSLTPGLNKLSGRVIRDRTLKVIRLPDKINNQCHIIYIGQTHHQRYKRLITQTRDKAILSISQIPGFAENGGIIELHRRGGQTSISVNLDSANNAGITLSSRLLILADIIEKDNSHHAE